MDGKLNRIEFLLTISAFYGFNFAENNESSLIVIILDSNPSQRIIRQNPQHLTQCLDSICVLGNAHLMQRANNSLAVLACHHHTTWVVYPNPNRFDSEFPFPIYFQWISVFNANGPRRRHSSSGRTIRKIHSSRENDQKQFGQDSECGPKNAPTAWINVGRQHRDGTMLHCTFGTNESTRQQIERSHLTADGQRRVCVAVHDLHERILHRTKAKHRSGCMCTRQSNDIVTARLWHHWRPVLTIAANRWTATVFIGESIKYKS